MAAGSERKLQERVRGQMMELIGHMDFKFSTRLLSENQLAGKFGVSRSTIRAVLTQLENEGKVIRRHGSGTYINPPALDVETTLYPRVNMYDLIRKNGFVPQNVVLKVEEKQAGDYGVKLNLFSFDRMIEVHSIYEADGKPCMYCIDRLDARRFGKVNWTNMEDDTSIYELIRKQTGVDITWDILRIMASDSNRMPVLRECFSVPEGEVKSVVKLELSNFDSQNRLVLLGNIYVDAEQIRLNIVRELVGL